MEEWGGYTTYESLIRYITKLQYLDPDLLLVYHSINDLNSRRVFAEKFKSDNSGYRHIFRLDRNHNIIFIIQDHVLLLRMLGVFLDKYEFHLFSLTNNEANLIKKPYKELLFENDVEYYRRNLESFIFLTKARGALVVFPKFAYLEEKIPSWNRSFLIEGIKQQNEVIDQLNKKYSLVGIDLNELLPKNKEFWYDEHHVNEKGAQVKAELIASELLKNNLIPKVHTNHLKYE